MLFQPLRGTLEFENWAVIALGGIPNKVQVGDMGIDGRIYPVGAMPIKAAKGGTPKRAVASELGGATADTPKLNDNDTLGGATQSPIVNRQSSIPVTYVPAPNTIFLSIALGYAEVIGVWDIFIGVNAIDYSGYPDCRPAFIEAFERMANLATAAAVEGRGRFAIHAPLVHMTKAEIIRAGLELGVDYSLTHSCYDPSPEGVACGRCDSCRLRLAGFAAVGASDPGKYR